MARNERVVILVTCGSAEDAGLIAEGLVEQRLAACVNVVESPVRSVYRWKDSVESSSEHLLFIKTARRLLPKVQAEVERLHSYEVPEFIALSIDAGSASYLKWMDESLAKAK